MTLYFSQVFTRFCTRFGYRFLSTARCRNTVDADLLLAHDGVIPKLDGDFRGSHIIRDPRDLIVSGYFYHLRTSESWCTEPTPANDDLPADISYQAHLESLSQEDGLIFEMEHVSGTEIDKMLTWDYERPEFLELRFEDVLGNERATLERVFHWYGFSTEESRKAGSIAKRYAATRLGRLIKYLKGSRHIRPGTRVGQWRDYFTPRVSSRFEERFGDALHRLGYSR